MLSLQELEHLEGIEGIEGSYLREDVALLTKENGKTEQMQEKNATLQGLSVFQKIDTLDSSVKKPEKIQTSFGRANEAVDVNLQPYTEESKIQVKTLTSFKF